jgi:hypothetical protein
MNETGQVIGIAKLVSTEDQNLKLCDSGGGSACGAFGTARLSTADSDTNASHRSEGLL